MTYRRIATAEGVTLEPQTAAASVVWLHGLGADGNDFVPIVPELRLPPAPGIRYVFPHATVRPVTLNNGYPMRAWYDIKSLDPAGRAEAPGLDESVARISALIDRERAAGVAANRIVVAGFSQGGAVAFHCALAYPERLGGLLALSTYLPRPEHLEPRLSAANRTLPILMCHGTEDPVVVPAMAATAREWLLAHGFSVDWRTYPMPHSVCPAEVADIGRWLAGRLAPSPPADRGTPAPPEG
jgi:phospholipase/carboxylesterase